jgi:putative transposase
LRAFKRGCETYGPPDAVKIDNGKNYDSEMWTGTTKKKRKALKKGYLDEKRIAGLYGKLGINVSFAIPYNAKAKPIERFFATLDDQFVRTMDPGNP